MKDQCKRLTALLLSIIMLLGCAYAEDVPPQQEGQTRIAIVCTLSERWEGWGSKPNFREQLEPWLYTQLMPFMEQQNAVVTNYALGKEKNNAFIADISTKVANRNLKNTDDIDRVCEYVLGDTKVENYSAAYANVLGKVTAEIQPEDRLEVWLIVDAAALAPNAAAVADIQQQLLTLISDPRINLRMLCVEGEDAAGELAGVQQAEQLVLAAGEEQQSRIAVYTYAPKGVSDLLAPVRDGYDANVQVVKSISWVSYHDGLLEGNLVVEAPARYMLTIPGAIQGDITVTPVEPVVAANEAAPAGDEAAVGEAETAPAGEETAADEVEAAPAGEETAAGEAEAAPAGDETTAGEAEAAPAGEETAADEVEAAPAGDETTAGEAEAAPAGEETAAGEAEAAPAGDETTAGEAEAAPAGEETAADEVEAAPAGDETTAGEAEAAPAGEGTAADEVEAAPAGEGTAADEVEAAPAGEETAADEVEAAPAGDETAADEVEAAPAGEETAADEVEAAPAGDETAAGEAEAAPAGDEAATTADAPVLPVFRSYSTPYGSWAVSDIPFDCGEYKISVRCRDAEDAAGGKAYVVCDRQPMQIYWNDQLLQSSGSEETALTIHRSDNTLRIVPPVQYPEGITWHAALVMDGRLDQVIDCTETPEGELICTPVLYNLYYQADMQLILFADQPHTVYELGPVVSTAVENRPPVTRQQNTDGRIYYNFPPEAGVEERPLKLYLSPLFADEDQDYLQFFIKNEDGSLCNAFADDTHMYDIAYRMLTYYPHQGSGSHAITVAVQDAKAVRWATARDQQVNEALLQTAEACITIEQVDVQTVHEGLSLQLATDDGDTGEFDLYGLPFEPTEVRLAISDPERLDHLAQAYGYESWQDEDFVSAFVMEAAFTADVDRADQADPDPAAVEATETPAPAAAETTETPDPAAAEAIETPDPATESVETAAPEATAMPENAEATETPDPAAAEATETPVEAAPEQDSGTIELAAVATCTENGLEWTLELPASTEAVTYHVDYQLSFREMVLPNGVGEVAVRVDNTAPVLVAEETVNISCEIGGLPNRWKVQRLSEALKEQESEDIVLCTAENGEGIDVSAFFDDRETDGKLIYRLWLESEGDCVRLLDQEQNPLELQPEGYYLLDAQQSSTVIDLQLCETGLCNLRVEAFDGELNSEQTWNLQVMITSRFTRLLITAGIIAAAILLLFIIIKIIIHACKPRFTNAVLTVEAARDLPRDETMCLDAYGKKRVPLLSVILSLQLPPVSDIGLETLSDVEIKPSKKHGMELVLGRKAREGLRLMNQQGNVKGSTAPITEEGVVLATQNSTESMIRIRKR